MSQIEYFRFQQQCLNLMGTFLVREKNTTIRRVQSFINLIMFPWNLIPILKCIAHYFPDFLMMSDFLNFLTSLALSLVKLSSLHFGYHRFEELNDKIIELGTSVVRLDERKVIVKAVDYVQFVSKANLTVLQIASLIIGVLPLLSQPVLGLIRGGDADIVWPDPFNFMFPFDLSNTFVYVAVTLILFWEFLQVGTAYNAVDSIFLESCLVIAAHFKVLQMRIENIQFGEKAADKEVHDIVVYHTEIYNAAEEIRNTYGYILLFYFAITPLILCVSIFSMFLVRSEILVIFIFLLY